MKRKTFLISMAAVFVALMALVLFVDGLPAAFSSVMAFPFEQLGAGLRALALLPVLGTLGHWGQKSFLWENIALCCLGVCVYATLFGMANPAKLLGAFSGLTPEALPVLKSILGSTAWSFVIAWVVLRLVRLLRAGDTDRLLCYLRGALQALGILFAGAVAVSCGAALVEGLSTAQRSIDGLMAVIRFAVAALPYLFDIGIILGLLSLLEAYQAKNEADAGKYAQLLGKRCCLALGVTAASTAGLNVAQLLLARFLSQVSVHAQIPVTSLAFILLILILSRLVVENQRLQSDNDLFI